MRINEFFYFQKSDRKVLLFCLATGVVAAGIFCLVGGKEDKTPFSASDTVYIQRSDVSPGDHKPYRREYYEVKGREVELFPFDPNTADSTQLIRLGLRPWQIRNIYKYRAKGGIYREPKDFARLYGLTVKQYRQLEPYIKISPDYAPASSLVEKGGNSDRFERDTILYPVKIKPAEHVILNTADTSMLKKVPGIGSGWARAIVAYGERLGGYTDVSQLCEIDGFPEDALQYFVVENPQTRKMNLNKLTLNQLKRHPYINFYQAREICDYRRLKGPLTSLEQLRLLKDFSPETINRLTPYVEF